jgi:hypothetical protein
MFSAPSETAGRLQSDPNLVQTSIARPFGAAVLSTAGTACMESDSLGLDSPRLHPFFTWLISWSPFTSTVHKTCWEWLAFGGAESRQSKPRRVTFASSLEQT